MSNESLNRAKSVKNDEFYTRYTDVDKELRYYARWLRNKSVICPCDHPRRSRIYGWLKDNFRQLGLKRLYSSHLESPRSYWTEYDGEREREIPLKGNGDFLGAEVCTLINKADVVITNPPFSLIRPFVHELYAMRKRYLFVAPLTILYYSDIFPHVKSGNMRVGHNMIRSFDNSQKHFGNVSWVTNYPVPYPEPLSLADSISPSCTRVGDVQKMDRNYKDVLHVPRYELIPRGYKGYMAVPSTILYHYNPRQIEIVDHTNKMQVNGKYVAERIIIKLKTRQH